MTSVLYPRLPRPAAEHLLNERLGAKPDALGSEWATEFPVLTYAPTGGAKAAADHLADVREVVIAEASALGFPGRVGSVEHIQFDRRAAPAIFQAMHLVPAEAVVPGVWDFLSLVLLPDVVMWRFGTGNRERWLCDDKTRHTFSRLWWQAYLLAVDRQGELDTTVLDALSESELNQILERRNLSDNPVVARAVAAAFIKVRHTCEPTMARRLIRDVAPRLLRLRWFLALNALPLKQLGELFERLFVESAIALQADADVASGRSAEGWLGGFRDAPDAS